jgi:methylenetetrahydrofolate dehydrogenase (NADP+)/methenyltetrahydrofolate cyclohydrolase
VLVGEDPASQVYVGSKVKQTEAIGMVSIEHRLPTNTPEGDLLALVAELNRDKQSMASWCSSPAGTHQCS